ANPELQKVLMAPENLPALKDGLRLKGFSIPGADSVDKQRGEFERLLRQAPMDNPEFTQLKKVFDQAEEGMKQSAALGKQLPPEAAAMLQQLQQHLATVPPQISTITVAPEDSENHLVEAEICFKWMNSSEGQTFKWGDNKQKAAFSNVALHRSEHLAVA